MNESPEKITQPMEGGSDAGGQVIEQSKEQRETGNETSETSIEQSPQQEISDTIGKINHIDQEIAQAQKSVAETETKLVALRKDMGVPENNGKSPAADFQDERIKKIEEEKQELAQKKGNWIKQYGRENLPDGLVLEDENGDLEAKGGSWENEKDQELNDKEKKEDLELRKQWLKKSEEDVVKHFEEAMRDDWRTKDAMNLDLTIQLMRLRVPKAMDKEADDFINGKMDEPPFSTVWIKWQASSPLDRILNKPNWISKLEITFDDEVQKIADDAELKKEGEAQKAGTAEATGAEGSAA